MARRPRLDYEGAVHHVYPRGNRRERIAHDDQDYRTLERYMIEAAARTGVKPRAWYPMPNHVHALVETPKANLSEFMQHWLSRYAQYYNRRYVKIGHVFQGRFGSRLVQKETYLKELIRYIHLQRYRAKSPDDIDASCDRYSSHRFYMGETCPQQVWAWIEPMLELFGETLNRARRAYAEFLTDGLSRGNWENCYKPQGDALGDKAFAETIRAKYEHAEPIAIPLRHQERLAQALLNTATRSFNVSRHQLFSPSQRRALCRIRQAIVFVGRDAGLSVTLLAQALHKKRPAVSLMLHVAPQRALREIRTLRIAFREST